MLAAWAMYNLHDQGVVDREHFTRIKVVEREVHKLVGKVNGHTADPTIHHARLNTIEGKIDLVLQRLDSLESGRK